MSNLFPDTTTEAEAVLVDLIRQAPPWRRLDLVWQLNATVRALAESGLRQRYPQDPPEKIQRRLANLLLGEELALRVYGPLEDFADAS